MSTPKKHYRVVRAYGPWSVGHVFTEMQGNEARTRIARGLLEEVTDKAMKSPANRMMSAPDRDLLGGQAVRKAGSRKS